MRRSPTAPVLLTATWSAGTVSVTVHGVFQCGSSKQGMARRALIDSNCVKAYQRSPSRCLKRPRVSLVE